MKYGAIVADPPWNFAAWSERGEGRSAKNHYGTMDLEAIKRLPVASIAARDCALFLWVINPMLPQALEVMEAWDFEFRTVAFTWVKTIPQPEDTITGGRWHMGLGYWTRANAELCLLGIRGNPKRYDRGVRSLIVADRRSHSEKPDAAIARIERLVNGPYVELFARGEARPGWHVWGEEAIPHETGTRVELEELGAP